MIRSATAAVVYEPDGKFSLEAIELDDLRSDEILVRIEASGVCHTDIGAQKVTPLPAVLGHEGTGVVEAIGSKVSRVSPGDRVIISYPWCGICPSCVEGRAYICEHVLPLCFGGTRLDGSQTITLNGNGISSAFFQQSSFATHSITLERDVVPVEGDHLPEMLAAIPCGVQTGAGAILNTFKVGPMDGLAVFGAGAVGLSAVMAGHLSGASPLIAVDIVEERLQLAIEMGATHALNANQGDIPERIREIAPRGVAFSLETTSNEHVLEDAIECLGVEGQCGMVTVAHRGEKFPFTPFGIFRRCGSLRGIIQGFAIPNTFLPKLIEMNRQGKFPYERMIKTYDFADINTAFEDTRAGRTIKPVLKMS
ncbi:MAG: NAD(P)-dependent alcohol dehydrogenase [Deltaproteobacteria bacterium]|nr:NAD(P)-dependent alcohol dehydrogenase [Deltaproteobacteria bacterium]